jgi:hypothetical protein
MFCGFAIKIMYPNTAGGCFKYFNLHIKKYLESETTSNGSTPTTTNRNNDSNLQWICHQHIEEKKTKRQK